jgi:hypothetical protein
MLPSVRNRRLGMVSPRRGLGKQSRRMESDGGQGLYAPFFNALAAIRMYDRQAHFSRLTSLRPSVML